MNEMGGYPYYDFLMTMIDGICQGFLFDELNEVSYNSGWKYTDGKHWIWDGAFGDSNA